MSETGDWYAQHATMPLRTRLMSVLLYIVAGTLVWTAIGLFWGDGSLAGRLVGGLFVGLWLGVFTVFVVPTAVMWWRRRQGS